MRVIVTGGAGYIGSVVVEELVRGGHSVLAYDNLSKGHRTSVVPGAELAVGDLGDADKLRAALSNPRADAVVHMAAWSLVGESVQDPAKYYANNVGAGLALLDGMRACGVDRLVFSSTAAVYGEPDRQPIDEDCPTAPTNPYGETKLAFEHALRWYRGAYGLRSISLRYFNAAGATDRCGELHEPESHLVPLLLRAAAGKLREIVVFGDDYPTPDGTCVRDYIHVHDLARAHVLALEALSGKAAHSPVYNLGCGGRGYSVREVIDAARRVTGREIPVRIGPRRPGDPAVLVASSERIARELGFRPQLQDLSAIVESAWRFQQQGGPLIVT
jgi:UDP-glucose 4-epimerase